MTWRALSTSPYSTAHPCPRAAGLRRHQVRSRCGSPRGRRGSGSRAPAPAGRPHRISVATRCNTPSCVCAANERLPPSAAMRACFARSLGAISTALLVRPRVTLLASHRVSSRRAQGPRAVRCGGSAFACVEETQISDLISIRCCWTDMTKCVKPLRHLATSSTKSSKWSVLIGRAGTKSD